MYSSNGCISKTWRPFMASNSVLILFATPDTARFDKSVLGGYAEGYFSERPSLRERVRALTKAEGPWILRNARLING